MGYCGVQFRVTEDGSTQDPCDFSFGTLCSSFQADGIWFPQYPLVLQFWVLWGAVQADRSPEDLCGFALSHYGVQFRLIKSGLLKTSWGFCYRTLWGSVQADRRWVTTGHMCFQLWDIVGFTSGKWTLVSSEPTYASVFGHCGVQFRLLQDVSPQETCHFGFGHNRVQFRLMESDLFRTCWAFSFVTLRGSGHANMTWVTIGPM